MSNQSTRRPLLIAALAGLAASVALAVAAAVPNTSTDPAIGTVMGEGEPASVQVADNDRDEDGDAIKRHPRGHRDRADRHERKGDHRGRHHDDDDHESDDDDDDDGGRATPRRSGPAPAQNPLIGAPTATVN